VQFLQTPSVQNLECFGTALSFGTKNPLLHFTPKSTKLARPTVYDFDIYIRAAEEIQRHFRGHLSRVLAGGSFPFIRRAAILIQRAVRLFL
jgi:hypothetical protein